MNKKSFGMIKAIYAEDITTCVDAKCSKSIIKGTEYYMDILPCDPQSYCDECGKCLRYARKKASQRGERIETATLD